MIPAIDPGLGLTEDRPLPKPSSPGSAGFSSAFERARGTASRDEARKPLSETRPAHDSRAREAYGKSSRAAEKESAKRREGSRIVAHEAREAPPKTSDQDNAKDAEEAAGTGKAAQAHRSGKAQAKDEAAKDGAAKDDAAQNDAADLEAASQAASNPALQATSLPEESLSDVAADPAIESLTLQAVNPEQRQGVADDATPITAQIGAAAYRLAQHGKDEAKLAEGRGIVLPDGTQEQMLGEGVRDVRFVALQKGKEGATDPELEGKLADEKKLVEPSKVARDERARDLSYREQIALQTAQSRNDVLARLSADAGQAEAAGAGDALRRHMQLQGLLAHTARTHAVEATSPNAPATVAAGAGVPAGSVNLQQVYETPNDDAVQHRVLERVANEARWLIRNDRQEVTFRMSPEHLGALHMKVMHHDGQFRVDLTVDNLAAKHLLESNLQDLRNRLLADNPGGEFLFNVDVRQGNQQPSLHSRPERMAPRAVGRIEGLEQSPAPGLAGRVIGQSGLSIYA